MSPVVRTPRAEAYCPRSKWCNKALARNHGTSRRAKNSLARENLAFMQHAENVRSGRTFFMNLKLSSSGNSPCDDQTEMHGLYQAPAKRPVIIGVEGYPATGAFMTPPWNAMLPLTAGALMDTDAANLVCGAPTTGAGAID